MAKTLINVGSTANDGTGDSLRVGGQTINAVINEIYDKLGDITPKVNLNVKHRQ